MSADVKNKKWNRLLIRLLLICAVYVMALSAYNLWAIYSTYAEGDQAYKAIAQEVRQSPAIAQPGYQAESQAQTPAETANSEPTLDIPALDINFEALKTVNEDAAGWLYCPDTVIDYPVMKADDYEWYLRHLPDGTYNNNGSLFLDYHCPQDFSGRLSIIYGHNMKSGKMFSPLMKYKEQDYFARHPYMYLYTEQQSLRVDLIYGCLIAAGKWNECAFMLEDNLPSLLNYAAGSSTFESGIEYQLDSDRFIVLSTCSYEFSDARYVVIGTLNAEYSD